MINRTVAAGVCAICCIAFLLAPSETSARSGGIAGRSLAIGAPRVGALPLVKPGQVPAINAAVAGGFHAVRRGHARRHHRFLRQRIPLAGVGVYGSYFVPDDGITLLSPDAQTVVSARPVPPGEPVAVNGRICFAQAYIVPSEAGGTRPVTVTRC